MQTENLYIYSILKDNKISNINNIRPEYMMDTINSEIYKCMLECVIEKEVINIDTLKDYVYEYGYNENVKKSIINRLISIDKMIAYPADSICSDLKDKYIEKLKDKLVCDLLNKELPLETKVKCINEVNYKLLENINENEVINYQADLNNFINDIDKNEIPMIRKRSIELKNEYFKLMFGDFLRPVVYILAGLPGFHKTSIIINFIKYLTELKKMGLVFTFEDPIDIWRFKYLAIKDSLNFNDLMNFHYTEGMRYKIKQNYTKIENNKIWISHSGYNIQQFINEIDRQMLIRKFDYIVIDYIELFRYNHNDEPRQLKMIMNELRRISIKYLIPIIVLSQIDRRRDEKEDEVTPILKDLYGSSGLEKAARRVMMIGGYRNDNIRHIFVRKSSYTALCNFKIEINLETGGINGIA